MKAKYKIALAMAGSSAPGAIAVQTLHAAATPPAYVIGEITVKDEDGHQNDLLPVARKPITDAGGKYLAGGFNKTVTFEGAPPPNRVVILQFEKHGQGESMERQPSQQRRPQKSRQVRHLPHVRCRRCAATIAMHSNGSAVH